MTELLGFLVMLLGSCICFGGHLLCDYIDFMKGMEDQNMDLYKVIMFDDDDDETVIDRNLTWDEAIVYVEDRHFKNVRIEKM